MHILAIDIGTSSLKAGLFDTSDGRWIALASRPITTEFNCDRTEQDARQYWSAMRKAIIERTRAALERTRR